MNNRNNMIDIALFRVPTCEILEELTLRVRFHCAANFTECTSKELLNYIIENRIDSFNGN